MLVGLIQEVARDGGCGSLEAWKRRETWEFESL